MSRSQDAGSNAYCDAPNAPTDLSGGSWLAAARRARREKSQGHSLRERQASQRGAESWHARLTTTGNRRRMADDEALRVSSSGNPPWLVIAGEIDESTYPILLAGLAAAEGYREIRIDLSGVRYCDLAGLHRIVRLTGPASASGRPIRRVVLHAVPSWLAEILQILGWDTIPGIALEEITPERERERAGRLNRLDPQ
jgi:ABC-type transporter Mla MlaB component